MLPRWLEHNFSRRSLLRTTRIWQRLSKPFFLSNVTWSLANYIFFRRSSFEGCHLLRAFKERFCKPYKHRTLWCISGLVYCNSYQREKIQRKYIYPVFYFITIRETLFRASGPNTTLGSTEMFQFHDFSRARFWNGLYYAHHYQQSE